jgi:hypothetical protein
LHPMAEVYICPRCGRPVGEHEPFVLAQEYENAPGVGQRDFEPEALAKRALRHFHVGHFVDRIGNHLYELVGEQAPETAAE